MWLLAFKFWRVVFSCFLDFLARLTLDFGSKCPMSTISALNCFWVAFKDCTISSNSGFFFLPSIFLWDSSKSPLLRIISVKSALVILLTPFCLYTSFSWNSVALFLFLFFLISLLLINLATSVFFLFKCQHKDSCHITFQHSTLLFQFLWRNAVACEL